MNEIANFLETVQKKFQSDGWKCQYVPTERPDYCPDTLYVEGGPTGLEIDVDQMDGTVIATAKIRGERVYGPWRNVDDVAGLIDDIHWLEELEIQVQSQP